MQDLKFDIYAMSNPKTPEDYSRLLDEGLRLLKELNEHFDAIFESDTKE